ncbi:hypothetical protein VitviT2T_004087 [Vitis vinifera]|uniref:Uncharacterized protein n=1 Tax=Vitis vinifera TaxID=29760 RepID=A0ABY9BP86_VITVI|nr:hypothetical protein VitviT2T_004087 [Vitis vinifera]
MQSAGNRSADVSTSGSLFDARQIWRVIEENKDLDSPAHKARMTTVHHEAIVSEKCLHILPQMKIGVKLVKIVRTGAILCFGKKLSMKESL